MNQIEVTCHFRGGTKIVPVDIYSSELDSITNEEIVNRAEVRLRATGAGITSDSVTYEWPGGALPKLREQSQSSETVSNLTRHMNDARLPHFKDNETMIQDYLRLAIDSIRGRSSLMKLSYKRCLMPGKHTARMMGFQDGYENCLRDLELALKMKSVTDILAPRLFSEHK